MFPLLLYQQRYFTMFGGFKMSFETFSGRLYSKTPLLLDPGHPDTFNNFFLQLLVMMGFYRTSTVLYMLLTGQ